VRVIGVEEHFLTDEIHRARKAIGLEAADPSMAFHSGTFEVRPLDLAENRREPTCPDGRNRRKWCQMIYWSARDSCLGKS
jgi:hypothetical protein